MDKVKRVGSPWVIPGVQTPLTREDLGGIPESVKQSCIISVVEKVTQVTGEQMVSKSRSRGKGINKGGKNIVAARFIAIYLLTEFTSLTQTEIGDRFGGRDHTVTIHVREFMKNVLEVGSVMMDEESQYIRSAYLLCKNEIARILKPRIE